MQKSKPIKAGDLVRMLRKPSDPGVVLDVITLTEADMPFKSGRYRVALVQWPNKKQRVQIGQLENLSGKIRITE
jgi:hypothetical protein